MLLEEVDYKSELMKKAMNQNIQTVEEFEIWLLGYSCGYKTRQEEIMKIRRENDEL